jgi:hypothetical protein
MKLDVDDFEFAWTRALHEVRVELVPPVFASGEILGGEAVRWLVHERMPWTLSHAWPDGLDVEIMVETGVRFQEAARRIDLPVAWAFSEARFRELIERAIGLGAPQSAEVLLGSLTENWAWLVSLCGEETIFGDLITSNVAVREGPPVRSPGLLLDVIAVRGPWPLEAAWPEGKSGVGHYRGLVRKMARPGGPRPQQRNGRRDRTRERARARMEHAHAALRTAPRSWELAAPGRD